MLIFLRKIRRKLLSSNKLSTYVLYAVGEILLVVIGILIAVQIDEWNTAKNDRKKELQSLQNIQLDLEKDLNSLSGLLTIRHERVIATKNLISHISGDTILSVTDIIAYIGTALSEGNFTPSNITFTELSNSGNLNILSNDSIKFMLLELTKDYARNNELIAHETFDYREYISKPTNSNFDLNKYGQIFMGTKTIEELNIQKAEFDHLLKSMEYKNGLHLISLMSSNYITFYEEIMRKKKSVIKLIEIELKK